MEGDLNHGALSQDHPREIIPLLHEIEPKEVPERMAQGDRHWLSPPSPAGHSRGIYPSTGISTMTRTQTNPGTGWDRDPLQPWVPDTEWTLSLGYPPTRRCRSRSRYPWVTACPSHHDGFDLLGILLRDGPSEALGLWRGGAGGGHSAAWWSWVLSPQPLPGRRPLKGQADVKAPLGPPPPTSCASSPRLLCLREAGVGIERGRPTKASVPLDLIASTVTGTCL